MEKKGRWQQNLTNEDYVHKNLPLRVWEGFKKAKSFGSYYDALIKNRYQLDLIQR
jgi:hypothetical protein